jgi:integrase
VPADFSNGQKTNRGRRKTYTPLLYLTGYGTPADPHWPRRPLKGPNLGWRNLIGDKTKLSAISGRRLAELKEDLFSKYPVRIVKWFPKDGKKRGEKRIVERKRSFTDVNLRLQVLRKMFTVARVDLRFDNGDPWMKRNPFQESSDPLIEVKKNLQRNRIMTFEEEALLRSVSDGPREHLALIVTGLVDTCMRSTEFFQLSVGDWRAREIAVQQMTTKTLRARTVPASSRFIDLISRWIEDNELTNDDWLLTRRSVRKADTRKNKPGMTDHVASCRTAWMTAKRLAGIRDLRLKDLRRTGATRLLRAGMPLAEISQILGHTDIKMTMVYIGVDHTSMDRAVGFLDKMHQQHATELQVSAEAN